MLHHATEGFNPPPSVKLNFVIMKKKPNLLPQFINKVPRHMKVMNDILNIVTPNFCKV